MKSSGCFSGHACLSDKNCMLPIEWVGGSLTLVVLSNRIPKSVVQIELISWVQTFLDSSDVASKGWATMGVRLHLWKLSVGWEDGLFDVPFIHACCSHHLLPTGLIYATIHATSTDPHSTAWKQSESGSFSPPHLSREKFSYMEVQDLVWFTGTMGTRDFFSCMVSFK